MYTLLIADDEIPIRKGLLSLDWASMNVRVLADVDNGMDAIELLQSEMVDVVLTDIRMQGKDTVRLCEEIDSLRNYVQIQKYRYSDKFTFELDIPSDTQALYVPKLTLQPLVENAISHGVELAFGNGVIRVSAKRGENDLLISVSDDGVGMDGAMVERLVSGAEESDDSIGLCNVIKRIRTLYGEPYGLTIRSELGEGTTIAIRLPITQKIEEE